MAELEQIEERIRRLSREERAALRQWFIAFEAEAWDASIDDDVAAGILDVMGEQALQSHLDGRTRPLQ